MTLTSRSVQLNNYRTICINGTVMGDDMKEVTRNVKQLAQLSILAKVRLILLMVCFVYDGGVLWRNTQTDRVWFL